MGFLSCVMTVLVSSSLLTWRVEVIAELITTNIDTEEPTVILSPALDEDADGGFGWAAVFHRSEVVLGTDDMAESLRKTRVVIGAPKGTFPGGLTLPGGLPLPDPELPAARNTGLVYNCPIPGPCVGVRGNTSVYIGEKVDGNVTNHVAFFRDDTSFFSNVLSEGRLFDQAPSTRLINEFDLNAQSLFDRKEGQLMGSFLASTGDRFLACASKYSYSAFSTIAIPSAQARGICFLGNRDLQDFSTVFPCDGSSTTFTTCSAGFSATLLDQGLNVGAPGNDAFAGGVFSRMYTDSRPLNELTGGSGYFGYQLVSGNVRSNDRSMPSDIAISAPRFNNSYLGRVFVYRASAAPSDPIPVLPVVIEGRQVSEFFGYSIALVDLTGDGFDELVVGAPMYTTFNPLAPERGRVYIYFNNGGELDVNNPVIFSGSGRYVRYGFTVANAGDLSGDGHEDLVVSAPYEPSSSTDNTGAVYVYYGNQTREDIEEQMPQKIHADDIVDSLDSMSVLKTFGFSVSGGVDVDNNRHDDILVGSPDAQAVVVLRSRPFVNVTVFLASDAAVNVDVDNSFSVTVTATYASLDIQTAINITFVLREDIVEQEPRLSFSPDDPNDDAFDGIFQFSGAGVEFPVTIEVYASTTVGLLQEDFQLELILQDITRNVPQVSGQQPVSDLSQFPRLRLQGEPNISVVVIDPCGTDGCSSDVELRPLVPATKTLVAGAETAVQFGLSYANIGTEDGRNLVLVISNIPTRFFSSASIQATADSIVTSCTPTGFSTDETITTANCSLSGNSTTGRLRENQERNGMLTLTLTSNFIGNEEDFALSLEIVVDTTNMNMDVNTNNNVQSLPFTVESQSGISVQLNFDRSSVEYMFATAPNPQSSGDLGALVTLRARVENTGPSIIQDASLIIRFPSRIADITGGQYLLYPTRLQLQSIGNVGQMAGTDVNCTEMGLDPDSLDAGANSLRKRRSVYPMNINAHRANREAKMKAAKDGVRRKRQAPSSNVILDCSNPESVCDTFTCEIRKLTQEGVIISLDSVTDGRFFGTEDRNRTFKLSANVSVSVEGFQRDDDQDATDNFATASIILEPQMAMDEGGGLLIHAIIWPIVGGVIIFILLVILLYCVGFFRRKKKPGDDEIEGDFEAPPEAEKQEKVAKADQEGTMM